MSTKTTTMAAALSTLAACAAQPHLMRLPDAREIQANTPAPYHLVLAPLEVAGGVRLTPATGLGAMHTADEVRDALLTDLRQLRTASTIGVVDGDILDAAALAGADLVLRPRLAAADFAYLNATSDGLLSSLLWIVSWAGGLFVPDSEYEGRLRIDWDVLSPISGQVIASLPGSSRSYQLDYLDRNAFWSTNTLQTLILPPFLTSDDSAQTSATLASLAIGNAACDVARFIKGRMNGEERELIGELRLDSPRNGDEVAANSRLRGSFLANDLVTQISLAVNGRTVVQSDADSLPKRSAQQIGAHTYRVPLPDVELGLSPGANRIVLTIVAGGRRSSRTLSLNSHTTEESR